MNVGAMGNTFKGYIAEFPGIRVDCFDDKPCPRTKITNDSVTFYLLTHAHTDHLTGLSSPQFSGKPVYCSSTTRSVLSADSSYNTNIGALQALPLNTRHNLTLHDRPIAITLIPANHCAGSVMFLIESTDKTVLLTGDIRAERSWVDHLPRNPILFPFTTRAKELDMVYLDTTYQYRPTPYIHILQNFEGLQILSTFLTRYPLSHEHVHFVLPQEVLGFEEVWAQVLGSFPEIRMSGSCKILERTKKVANCTGGIDEWYAQLVQQKMSLNDPSATFHIAKSIPRSTKKNVFVVTVKAVIDLSYEDLMAQTMPLKLPGKKVPKEFVFQFNIPGGIVYEHTRTKKRFLHLDDSDTLLGDEILYYFSRHSSYPECYDFLSMFNVADVYPIVEDHNSWFERGFSIQRHFGTLLNNNKYRYDEESMNFYGNQGSIRFAPPPTTQEKQTPQTKDFTQSMNEYESTHELSNIIRGQQAIGNAFGTADDLDLCSAELRYNDMTILGRKLLGNNQFRIERKILNGDAWTNTKRNQAYDDDYEYSEDEDNEDAIRFNALAKRAAEEEKRALAIEKANDEKKAIEERHKRVKLERLDVKVPQFPLKPPASGQNVVDDSQAEEEIVTSKDTISFRTETECDDEANLTEDDTLDSKDDTPEVNIVIKSPVKQEGQSKKLEADPIRVQMIEKFMIEKFMIRDVGQGFFVCDLQSCKGQK